MDPHQHDHATGHAARLDALEEAVNRQIDTDTRVLLDNFKEIINLGRVCSCAPFWAFSMLTIHLDW